MGKLGGLAVVAVLALSGCATAPAPVERVANVQPVASVQSVMLAELRPLLRVLKASDSELMREAYGACMTLVFRSKDSYREDIMKQHADVTLAVDHLTVAAAAKQHLCR